MLWKFEGGKKGNIIIMRIIEKVKLTIITQINDNDNNNNEKKIKRLNWRIFFKIYFIIKNKEHKLIQKKDHKKRQM